MNKIKIKNFIFHLFLIVLISSCAEQKPVEENLTNGEFPDSWAGSWKGEMVLTKNGFSTDTLNMALNIQRLDMQRTTWQIVYDTIPRNYELITARGIGHFQIDEGNSVFLDGYYANDEFSSVFSVNDVLLVTNYAIKGDSMIFTIRTYPQRLTSITGKDVETVDSIKSFREQVVQRAVLRR